MTKIFEEITSGSEAFEVTIGFNDISIKRDDIIQLLGYGSQDPPRYFTELAESAIASLENRIHIRAGYRILDDCIPAKAEGRAAGIFTFPEIISARLKNSEKIILFTVTIGPSMEELSREMISNGDPVLGYIYDLIASAAVDSCAEVLHKHIRNEMMKDNLKVTNRYSPGYCGWNVEQQAILFSYLPVNFCGIKLTGSSLMVPVKSISGIIGAGAHVRFKDYSCRKCEKRNCLFRSVQAAREMQEMK